MALFDVSKYEIPSVDDVDMRMTKKGFETFMTQYGSAREKVGKNRMPKMTQSFSPVPGSTNKEYSGDAERFLIEREMFLPEYEELHRIFGIGYLAISNPIREGATDRRRQLFMLRYVYGINVQDICDRTYLGKTSVVEETRLGLIQFCDAIGVLVTKDETAPLIKTITKTFE